MSKDEKAKTEELKKVDCQKRFPHSWCFVQHSLAAREKPQVAIRFRPRLTPPCDSDATIDRPRVIQTSRSRVIESEERRLKKATAARSFQIRLSSTMNFLAFPKKERSCFTPRSFPSPQPSPAIFRPECIGPRLASFSFTDFGNVLTI